MASLSLPRVLQLKKNSLDAEREQFEKFQTLAIQKAINSIETPVKEKHVRSTIIGTFQEQSAITYWMVAIRLPIQDNRIVAWKFCHVTHKLLREGHPACLDDSQRHINMIENLGKLWVHLREGYGRLVHLYCTLLVCKLKFHARNPRFPGNMQLTADELDAIAENDVNNYFQLCVELFDYMDDLLNLQAAVFDSLGNARANSMTASGQCRLAALIPCAQDASHMYDCNVRLLFRLHASLPPDTLAGHRERFRQQFKKLSSFYKHASSLQYYRNLLTLPVLPSNPPNFLLQSDFGTYVPPVVSIPEPAPDELDAVGSLIDTSDTISTATTPDHLDAFDTRATPSPQPDPVVERDRLIDHLQNEMKRMRLEVSQLVQERNTMLGSMREHCTRLESQLHSTKTELEEERQRAEVAVAQTPEIKKKLVETEEKAKVTDEKFQKLKGAYTQLREEHITLIRQKAEVDKLASSLRAAAAQHESSKMLLQQQLNDRVKDVELLQQSASSSEEIEAYKTEIANLRAELENSRQKEGELETLKSSLETLEIEHKTASTEQQEKLAVVTSELKETTETLQKIKQEKEEQEKELSKVKEELLGLRQRSGEEYKKAIEEKDAALKQVTELTQQYQQEKEEQAHHTKYLESELQLLKRNLTDAESKISVTYEKFEHDIDTKQLEFEKCLSMKEKEIKQILENIEVMKSEFELNLAKVVEDKDTEFSNLQASMDDLKENKNKLDILLTELEAQVNDLKKEKHETEKSLENANEQINMLKDKYKYLEESCKEKDCKISELQKILNTTIELNNKQLSDSEGFAAIITDLQESIRNRENEISDLKQKLEDVIDSNQKEKKELEESQKETKIEMTILEDKLQNVITCKDELINSLKNMITEKDSQVITLNVEVNKLADEVLQLKDELNETRAELEIGQNELLNLREEHDRIIDRNESNLTLKNQELRCLHDEIAQLCEEKAELLSINEKVTSKLEAEKQVLEKHIKDMEESQKQLYTDIECIRFEQSEMENKLNSDIERLKSEREALKNDKDNEVESLTEKINIIETDLNEQIIAKDKIITKTMQNVEELKIKLDEIEKAKLKGEEEMELVMAEKEKDYQMIVARLEHAEETRLTAECELQDLLQHNTALESDVAALRIQLEEAREEIKKQNARIVSNAGEAALEITDSAIAALDNSSAQDANKLAAEMALKAIDQLARHSEGNEELVAKSAISAAHNTAQLSAYASEVANVSTDMEAAEKLTEEVRGMLRATRLCVESLRGASTDTGAWAAARAGVAGAARAASALDGAGARARCVDDELADMDRAIEGAALQIEELLAASRAGDSGVKLEVNGKILDACTTLMGAVKVLVQDARRLQNELGDPTTRQKMYRKNPQWSEGLISAAKAVVFAAKLLVTSADEAVGSAGRVEGVSAAAHEVAGSTAQLVAASRARAPPRAPSLARLTAASRAVAAATGAVVAAVRAAAALQRDQEALDTSALTLTATRRLEMESKVRSLELESALDAERARLAALRKRHYHLAQLEENGNITNGKE